MGEQAKKQFIINVIFITLCAGIIIIVGNFVLKYLLPFVIAIAVAALMQKPAEIVSRKIHIKKGICATIISAVLYITLAGLLLLMVFKVFSFTGRAVTSLSALSNTAVEIFERLEATFGRLLTQLSPDFKGAFNKIISDMIESITGKLSLFLSETATGIVKAAPSFLFSSIVALAATCYIAKDFDGLVSFSKSLIKPKTVEALCDIKKILKTSVLKILAGYLILMVITFFELALGLLILGTKNWLLIALIIAFIDVLPVLGVGAVLIPWGIINIIIGNSFLGVGLMILYIIIVLIRNFAEPKIVGIKVGINPLFILFAMFLGLRLFGFAGLIILPVTFIVVIKYYKNEMEKESSH